MGVSVDPIVAIVGIAFAVFLLFLLLVSVLIKLDRFCEELRYINMEIRRASARERKYWKSRRRLLWLSLLPFVG